MREVERCHECGQTIYTHSSLNKGLAQTMINISRFIEHKEVNIFHPEKELLAQNYITSSQRKNISHLGNHGLIAKYKEPGNWVITDKGLGFLRGTEMSKIAIIEKATKTTVGYLDEVTDIKTLMKTNTGYWDQMNYEIKEGRIIREPKQSTLL